jgi:hypothetical protein
VPRAAVFLWQEAPAASAAEKGLVGSAKMGMKASALREKWDRRYFVPLFGRLLYYKDHAAYTGKKQPRGSLNMAQVRGWRVRSPCLGTACATSAPGTQC